MELLKKLEESVSLVRDDLKHDIDWEHRVGVLISRAEAETLIDLLKGGISNPNPFFKVTFEYSRIPIGRQIWTKQVEVFSSPDSIDLRQQVKEYLKERENAASERWYDSKMIDVQILTPQPPTE